MNRTKKRLPGLLLWPAALGILLSACSTGPDPVWPGPSGSGRIQYDPARGIVRAGTPPAADEQEMFARVERAFQERRYAECAEGALQLSYAWPDGTRAAEALLLRVVSLLEAGRTGTDGPPVTVRLDQWMFLYLSPVHDPRMQGFMDRGAEVRRTVEKLRKRDFDDFIGWLRPDALELASQGLLDQAAFEIKRLATYYLPAMEVESFRLRTAELARDVAWLAYAAGANDLTLETADDIRVLNPLPSVKADALYIEGHALRANGAHVLAAPVFERLFRGANLKDTDTRWRSWALYWMIVETARTAKGPEYDIAVYERALDQLGDYELYRTENPNLEVRLQQRFEKLIWEIYEVFVQRAVSAADTYLKLGETGAAAYCLRRAEDWKQARERRLLRLGGGER